MDPVRVHTFIVHYISLLFSFFIPIQKEVYAEYMDLMYGDAPEQPTIANSDSEIEITRPTSKLNTPACHDSSSEDGALNERIQNRRMQLGVFEKTKSSRKCFSSSDSDSSVPARPKKHSKQAAATKPSSAPTAVRDTRSKHPIPRVSSSKHTSHAGKTIQKTSKKTLLQRLANPKCISKIPTASPFTEFPTPVKGGPKEKKKSRAALNVSDGIDNVTVVVGKKRKPGRPRKGRKGGNTKKRASNKSFEEKYNDPPLALREALPDTHKGDFSDEEDPLTMNLHGLDIEFENGLESPLTWIFGDCHSDRIPVVDTIPFNPPYKPGVNIPNIRSLSAAEVMERFHPNSLYNRFATESNGYFYRWQHGNADADDEEERDLYKVPLYDLNWKDRT